MWDVPQLEAAAKAVDPGAWNQVTTGAKDDYYNQLTPLHVAVLTTSMPYSCTRLFASCLVRGQTLIFACPAL